MESWRRTLYVLFFAQLVTAMGFSIIFPFLPLYVEELGSETGWFGVEFWAGMVFSAQAFTMMIASPIWGRLADRYGRKLMIERAMIGGAIIYFLMSFASSAEQLVLLRAVQGCVTGVVSAVSAMVASTVPRERLGSALGLLQVARWGGVSLGPLLGGVIADFMGFEATFILTSILLGLSGVLVLVAVQENFEPVEHVRQPQQRFLNDWREILALPGVKLVYGIRFLSWLSRSVVLPFTPLFVLALMHSESNVATVTGLISGLAAFAGTLGALWMGRLGDRVGHRKVFIAGALSAAIFYLPHFFVSDIWQLVVLQFLVGISLGGIMPALSALLAQYTRDGDEGAVYGLENSVVAAARMVAPLIGASVVVWFSIELTFVMAGVLFLLTAALAFWYLPEQRPVVLKPVPAS